MATVFEHEPCSRCGGSGRHSFNQMHGDTCYGCNGRGWQYTKRGAAASKFFAALFTVPTTELQPEDRVYDMGRWRTVVANDQEQRRVTFTDGTLGYEPSSTKRRKATSEDERQRMIQKALDYQATLTKAGNPRKR